MVSMAFEITVDDVHAALLSRGIQAGEDDASRLFDQLDLDAVEGAALWGATMQEQTHYAYEEIARQLLDDVRGTDNGALGEVARS